MKLSKPTLVPRDAGADEFGRVGFGSFSCYPWPLQVMGMIWALPMTCGAILCNLLLGCKEAGGMACKSWLTCEIITCFRDMIPCMCSSKLKGNGV